VSVARRAASSIWQVVEGQLQVRQPFANSVQSSVVTSEL
jgi:hypothetical protein